MNGTLDPEIVTALISALVTLLVSIGTWHVTMRQYREKNKDLVTKAVEDVKDTLSENIASIQSHLAVVDEKIETLSNRVEKHNGVIERTYKLEVKTDMMQSELDRMRDDK